MKNEETLVNIAGAMDEMLYNFCEDNEITFLEMASITLARMSHISQLIGEGEDFIKLMSIASDTIKNVNLADLYQNTNTNTELH